MTTLVALADEGERYLRANRGGASDPASVAFFDDLRERMLACSVPGSQMPIAGMWSFARTLYSDHDHLAYAQGQISGAEWVWQIVFEDVHKIRSIAQRALGRAA